MALVLLDHYIASYTIKFQIIMLDVDAIEDQVHLI